MAAVVRRVAGSEGGPGAFVVDSISADAALPSESQRAPQHPSEPHSQASFFSADQVYSQAGQV